MRQAEKETCLRLKYSVELLFYLTISIVWGNLHSYLSAEITVTCFVCDLIFLLNDLETYLL